MSFLSILLFASAFYFAHARPEWPNMLAAPSVPIMESSAYQEQLGGFMVKMSEAVDEYMTPLMTQLDLSKQDRLKTMGMNGFASFVNYFLLLIQEQANENARRVDDEDYGGFPPREDFEEETIEYESPYPSDGNSPFIAMISPNE